MKIKLRYIFMVVVALMAVQETRSFYVGVGNPYYDPYYYPYYYPWHRPWKRYRPWRKYWEPRVGVGVGPVGFGWWGDDEDGYGQYWKGGKRGWKK